MKSMLAGLVAGALILSPAMVFVPAATMAQDTTAAAGCADPASPQNRAGGFCEQSSGTKSLSDPQNSDSPECDVILTMLPADFFLTPGAWIEVAIPVDPCGNPVPPP